MEDLIHRVGIPIFIQIILECWNEFFLLIMLFTLLISRHRDKSNLLTSKTEIPYTSEIILFFISVFLYNLFDIVCVSLIGNPLPPLIIVRYIAEIGYCTIGILQTIFLLYMVKTYVVKKASLSRAEKLLTSLQIIQVLFIPFLYTTPFTKLIFYIDDMNNYYRSWAYYLWFLSSIISFVVSIFLTFIFRKKEDKFFMKVILIGASIPTVAFFFSMTYTGISFNNISASLSAMVVFILYEKYKSSVLVERTQELEQTQTQLAQSLLELEHSKNETLMLQIQPHFINNSLMALRSRCSDYPDIYESITNFSRYLHSNFEALSEARQIPFEQEMKNTESYLALEEDNFGEWLNVEYDIEFDDFYIPALSVQPLVENAVRHGIATYEQGGTVTISAKRKNGKIIIKISDRGIGKCNITKQQQNRKGIGIENVRARLSSMCDGKLEIIMGEQGTDAVITINDNSASLKIDRNLKGSDNNGDIVG